MGLSAGPALGGLILGAFGWPWIFYVNLPFAALGFASAWLVAPKTKTLATDRRFDAWGALLLTPALAALLLALTEARTWGMGPALVACLVAGPALLAAFVLRERRAPAPLIDLNLFRAPAFAAGGVGVLVSYAMLYGIFFAMAFAFVRGYRDTAIVAGLRLALVPIALGIVAPFAGKLSDTRPRLIMVSGMALCAASALALALGFIGGGREPARGHGRSSGLRRRARPLYRAQQQRDDRCGAAGPVRRGRRDRQSAADVRLRPRGGGLDDGARLAARRTDRRPGSHHGGFAGRGARGGRRGDAAARRFRGDRRGGGARPAAKGRRPALLTFR